MSIKDVFSFLALAAILFIWVEPFKQFKVEGVMKNICVILFWIWASGLGSDAAYGWQTTDAHVCLKIIKVFF